MTEDDLLEGIDAPLPVPPALRARLEEHLLARPLGDAQRAVLLDALTPRRRRWGVGLAAASVAAAAALVFAVVRPTDPGPQVALPAPSSLVTASPPAPAALPAPFPSGFLSSLKSLDAPTPRRLSDDPDVQQRQRYTMLGGTAATAGSGAAAPSAARVVPRLTDVAPRAAVAGQWVELLGTALAGTTRVSFGAYDAVDVQVLSAGRLLARVPGQVPGAVRLTVTTPDGTSNAVSFTVV